MNCSGFCWNISWIDGWSNSLMADLIGPEWLWFSLSRDCESVSLSLEENWPLPDCSSRSLIMWVITKFVAAPCFAICCSRLAIFCRSDAVCWSIYISFTRGDQPFLLTLERQCPSTDGLNAYLNRGESEVTSWYPDSSRHCAAFLLETAGGWRN